MKYKMIAFVMALTLASWAQTSTQITPSNPQQGSATAEKDACPCCEKMASAETKDGPSCCAHHDMSAPDAKESKCCAGKEKGKTSCCNSKDAQSCTRSKDKNSAACCGGEKCRQGCSAKKGEATAMSCCQGKQCAAHGSAGASQ